MKISSLLLCLLTFSIIACGEQGESRKDKTHKFEEWTIADFHEAYEKGSINVHDVIEYYVNRIELYDTNGPELNSVLYLNPEVFSITDSFDRILSDGLPDLPLFGIPVLIKDNINTAPPLPTTAGSRALEGHQAYEDSPLVKQLKAAGAIILGKANLSEWANFRGKNSTSGWSALGGQTKNPYDPTKNPCGSSSGSGVAVSANLTAVAIGTETNGSIMCPSHANGIVGIKPTVGLVSRTGIIPISSTQDIAGPMCRTVSDAARVLSCLTKIDSADSKMLQDDRKTYQDYTQFLNPEGLTGKRIGMWTQPMGVIAELDSLYLKTVEQLEQSGATIVPVDSILSDRCSELSFTVMLYEYKKGLNDYFSTLSEDARIHNLAELIAFNEEDSLELSIFGQEYLIAAQAKGDLQSEEYQKALLEMKRLSQQEGMDRVLNAYELDAIIAPTGSPAWTTDHENGDNYILGTSSPAAISGYPSITLPMGFIDGLPVGISFFSSAWSEGSLIEMAYAFEQATKVRTAPEL